MTPLEALIAALPDDLHGRAFTHVSWVDDRLQSYERLEFLGDGVLGAAVAEELYRRYSDVDEGRLAKLKAHVVSRRSCAVVARVLDLGATFEAQRVAGGHEDKGLSTNRNVLAALCEATIGACFLHAGYAATAEAVIAAFADRIAYAADSFVDHKTELQEQLARLGLAVSYRLVETAGPAHRRTFSSHAVIAGDTAGTGTGASKKLSEQAAARAALAGLPDTRGH